MRERKSLLRTSDAGAVVDEVVTSVRVESNGHHDHVRIWNRGGLAGALTVTKGDGYPLAQRLIPTGTDWEGYGS